MWTPEGPLYKLATCRSLRPLGAVTLGAVTAPAVMLELLATSDPLAPAPDRPATTAVDLDSARALLVRASQHEGVTTASRAQVDQVVQAFHTGATSHPTLVGYLVERETGLGSTAPHVFVVGDWSDSTNSWVAGFVHVATTGDREFLRLIDHADLTGDGVDEIVVEAWREQGQSYLVFLQYQGGHWREVSRGPKSWCQD